VSGPPKCTRRARDRRLGLTVDRLGKNRPE
jgi:hypothetical protein